MRHMVSITLNKTLIESKLERCVTVFAVDVDSTRESMTKHVGIGFPDDNAVPMTSFQA